MLFFISLAVLLRVIKKSPWEFLGSWLLMFAVQDQKAEKLSL